MSNKIWLAGAFLCFYWIFLCLCLWWNRPKAVKIHLKQVHIPITILGLIWLMFLPTLFTHLEASLTEGYSRLAIIGLVLSLNLGTIMGLFGWSFNNFELIRGMLRQTKTSRKNRIWAWITFASCTLILMTKAIWIGCRASEFGESIVAALK